MILALSVKVTNGVEAGARNPCTRIRPSSVDSHMQTAWTHGKPSAVQPEVQPDARQDPNAAIESYAHGSDSDDSLSILWEEDAIIRLAKCKRLRLLNNRAGC